MSGAPGNQGLMDESEMLFQSGEGRNRLISAILNPLLSILGKVSAQAERHCSK
jgi:hypothetical protein